MRILDGWLTVGLGNLPVDMDTKASSGTDKLGRRRRRRGSKRATFKFQLFQVSTRGRKEGRKRAGNERQLGGGVGSGWDEGEAHPIRCGENTY